MDFMNNHNEQTTSACDIPASYGDLDRPYFSDAALPLFDLSHYIAAPSLLTRKLLGRWIIAAPFTINWLWEPILRPLYNAPAPADSPYYFFILRKPTV